MDFKITDNDIVITENGDIQITDNADEIAQTVAHYFGTRKGYIHFQPYFGFDSEIITNSLSIMDSRTVQEQIADILKTELGNYISLLGVLDVQVNLSDDNKTAEVTLVNKTDNSILAKTTIHVNIERS